MRTGRISASVRGDAASPYNPDSGQPKYKLTLSQFRRQRPGHYLTRIVASAETTYADPSALLKLYIHQPESARMNAWRTRIKGPLYVTHHGRVEVINGICLAAFRKYITIEL